MDNTEFTDVVIDPDNEVITNLNIVDHTNYTDVVTNSVDPDNEVITNLNIVDNTGFTTNSADVDTSRTVKANINMGPSTLTTMKAETTLTSWSRLGSILTSTWQGFLSTWQGFLDNFEVMDGMTEGVQREFRDQVGQISRPRIEEAESSRSRRETTNLEQPGSRTFTIATPTVSLTAASERMPSPTTAVQPHWKTPTKLTPKGKELENKSVKDQRPDFKENDMRDHLSGCNDEDGDHLKLDIERLDEEEDQGPNKENEQNDVSQPSYWGGDPTPSL